MSLIHPSSEPRLQQLPFVILSSYPVAYLTAKPEHGGVLIRYPELMLQIFYPDIRYGGRLLGMFRTTPN